MKYKLAAVGVCVVFNEAWGECRQKRKRVGGLSLVPVMERGWGQKEELNKGLKIMLSEEEAKSWCPEAR